MAAILSIVSMLAGTAGIFLGFYYLGEQPELALKIVTISAVGVVGVLAFIRHFVFYKSDMKRLGWETDRPDWMFEVGFANLAFGAAGLLSTMTSLGRGAMIVSLAGYAIYLFQASILHGYRYFTDEKKSPSRLWRSCITTLLYAVMMGYFAAVSL
jgi:uncharacterized membrane protein YfcA